MVSAVAGTAVRAYTTLSAPAAPANSQAQLQRLQHQLSDNINCASAKTSHGKATIAAIQDKISSLKDQMNAKLSATAVAPSPGTTNTDAAKSSTDSLRKDGTKPGAAIGSTFGNLIDTYA